MLDGTNVVYDVPLGNQVPYFIENHSVKTLYYDM